MSDPALYLLLILAIILAGIVSVALLFLSDTGKGWLLKKSFNVIKSVYDNFGYVIKEKDEQLYVLLGDAITEVQKAFEDETMTYDELKAIMEKFTLLFKRMFDLLDKKWFGTVTFLEVGDDAVLPPQ